MPLGDRALVVSGVSTEKACSAVREECLEPTPLNAASECGTVFESLEGGGCSLERECLHTVTQSGVNFGTIQRSSVSCYRDELDWVCSCDDHLQPTSHSARLDGTLPEQGVCAIYLSFCDEGVLDPTSPKTCELDFLSSSRSMCHIGQECTQEGKAPSGEAVFSQEYLSVLCHRGSDPNGGGSMPFGTQQNPDAWRCVCDNGNSVDEFFGEDGSKVCLDAVTACSE
jgi:hypothetical protein